MLHSGVFARSVVWRAAILICAALLRGALAAPTSQPTTQPAPLKFVVTFDAKVHAGPYTGRVWVLCTTRQRGEPRSGPDWFNPEPFVSVEVRDWKPGEPLRIGPDTPAYPAPIRDWPAKRYRVQAVMDLAGDERHAPGAPGNAYSSVVRRKLAAPGRPATQPAADGPVELKINRIAAPLQPINDDRVRTVEIESRLLSKFHGRPVKMRAAVLLPREDAPPGSARYPTVYDIPGFGGDFRFIHWYRATAPKTDPPFAFVVLDPTCPLGHHVFADSANNGPRGAALVEELIPHLEKEFPLIPDARARFLTGHSSGGWASLWLQINYPDYFNGVWSLAPDPVDFRAFTNIDLYAPNANAYTDAAGKPIPVARMGGEGNILLRDFVRMEDMLGPGGQMHSFEAVFSPRGPDGKPKPLFDRKTGAIDPAVAKAWRAYDINRVLRNRWKEVAPKLRGKLHIICGEQDTFYLDGAVRLLAETLKELGSDAEIVLVPDHNHFTLPMSDAATGRYAAMAQRYGNSTSQPAR